MTQTNKPEYSECLHRAYRLLENKPSFLLITLERKSNDFLCTAIRANMPYLTALRLVKEYIEQEKKLNKDVKMDIA